MTEIAIIDYGLGNLRSVKKAIEKINGKATITKDKSSLIDSDGIIIPGVGAFADGIKNLKPYEKEIQYALRENKPVLGICLGMQLSLTKSYEGKREREGLDIVSGEVVSLPEKVKVPHMGWNNIKIRKNHKIFNGLSKNPYFYFVHSYYTNTESKKDILAECRYGIDFPAVISRKNYIGVQFHPEKSGKDGLKLLKNYLKICRST